MAAKSDTIEAILALNQSASRTFLAEFSNTDLDEYLDRLSELKRSQDESLRDPSEKAAWTKGDAHPQGTLDGREGETTNDGRPGADSCLAEG